MKVPLRHHGQGATVVLPQRLLEQAGMEHMDRVEATAHQGAIVLSHRHQPARAGWAAAAQAIVASGADALLWGELANEADASDAAWHGPTPN